MHNPWKHLDTAFDAQFAQRQPDTEQAPPAAVRCDRTRDMFDEVQESGDDN